MQSNSKKGSAQALKLQAILSNIEAHLLDDALKVNLENFKIYNNAIANANTIEQQRLQFKKLSEQMIALVDKLQGLPTPIYVQHCPMADHNSGANWLSLSSEIRNPYFGDKMLTCGTVARKIQ